MDQFFSTFTQKYSIEVILQKRFSKYCKLALLLALMQGTVHVTFSQTFPILPAPNYDTDHASSVTGTVTQSGGGGIAGILVKLKSSAGNIVSNTLTNDQGQYTLSAKAEPGNYTLEIEYPTDGFSVASSPAVFPLSGAGVENGKDFVLDRKPNTLTVCDVHSLTLTPWGLASPVYLNLEKPSVASAFSAVKLFTSATTSHPELQVVNTNAEAIARVSRLEVGAVVYHDAPGSSSSINSFMEFAKSNIGGSQNLVVPPATTYTYYDISSGKTATSANLSNAAYNTDGSTVQIPIAATAEITFSISGGNANFMLATNANAGACLVYTYPFDPLPVRLVSFDVTRHEGQSVVLEWETTEETKSKEFQIEKSLNALDWFALGAVPTRNMGVAETKYKFYDNVNAGEAMYYRLKMVDEDGSFSYSRIRSLAGTGVSTGLSIFPNPVLASAGQKLHFGEIASKIRKIEILFVTGAVAYSKESPDVTGVNLGHLPKGLYIVKAVLLDGQVRSSRLIIN